MRKTLEVFPSVCAPQRAAAKEPESRSRFLGVAGVGGASLPVGTGWSQAGGLPAFLVPPAQSPASGVPGIQNWATRLEP